jgi:hypothetical protein
MVVRIADVIEVVVDVVVMLVAVVVVAAAAELRPILGNIRVIRLTAVDTRHLGHRSVSRHCHDVGNYDSAQPDLPQPVLITWRMRRLLRWERYDAI